MSVLSQYDLRKVVEEKTIEQIRKENAMMIESVTDNKKKRISQVLNWRTKKISVVLEDIYQSQNASAVIRSCDCFGIQDAHIIENRNKYSINPDVTHGAHRWVDLYKYNRHENNTIECLKTLKNKGYNIVATSLEEDSEYLQEIKPNEPIALVFGTEMEGISDQVKELADTKVKIPMYGFTQSFNISVSTAIALSYLAWNMRKQTKDWKLNDEEKDMIRWRWLKRITRF